MQEVSLSNITQSAIFGKDNLDVRKLTFNMKSKSLTCRLAFRCSLEEKKRLASKAESCGLSMSDYVRQCAIGHSPKLRMTDAEIEAFKTLAEARGELVRIKNALKGKTQEQRKRYFDNVDFMRYWIVAVDRLIRQWYDIIDKLTG